MVARAYRVSRQGVDWPHVPILPDDTPLLQAKATPLESALPDFAKIFERLGQADPEAVRLAEIDFTNGIQTNFNIGSQKAFAGVLGNIGIPTGPVFESALELLDLPEYALVVADVFWGIVEEYAVDIIRATVEELMEIAFTAISEVLGSLVDIVSGIPIYGYIIDVAWDVGMGIKRLVDIAKESNKPPPEVAYARAEFDPQTDASMATNNIIGPARYGSDWTPIFKPPGLGRTTTYGELFSDQKLEGGGRRIRTRGQQAGWVGFIPGRTMVHRAFELEHYGTVVRDVGALYPSTRNMAVLAWGEVVKNSPAMYTVDADQARRQWAQYLFDLRIWIKETDALHKKTKRNFVNGLAKQMFGWADFDTPFDKNLGFENFGIWDPEGRLTGNVAAPIKHLTRLREMQGGNLNTITVAYVDGNYGAFQTDDALRSKLEERREQLLQHVARCNVDLENIPDIPYRLAMENAQFTCSEGPGGVLIAPPIEPGEVPPPLLPEGNLILKGVEVSPKRRAPPSFWKRHKSQIGVAVLGLGLAAAYRRYHR